MTTVIENLPTVLREPQNVEAREKMQCVAAMGGWMLYSASAHVGHSIAHVLGAHFHMPHGATCAYTLPSVFKLLASIMPDKIAYIGRLLGAEINSEMACRSVCAFYGRIGSASSQCARFIRAGNRELGRKDCRRAFSGILPDRD